MRSLSAAESISECSAIISALRDERDSKSSPSSAPPHAGAAVPKLNESAPVPAHLEPDAQTLRELGAYYRPHNERLFALLGRDLGWHDDPRYWWYR